MESAPAERFALNVKLCQQGLRQCRYYQQWDGWQ
jgi:hypothetical protein